MLKDLLTKSDKKQISGHLCMLFACTCWGLMSPLGKDAMTHGIPGIEMVTLRVTGAATCFWLTSLFTRNEKISKKDLVKLFLAAMFAIVFNQCCYTIGLSITSPINASIITTTLPILTMVMAAVFLHDSITTRRVTGVLLGAFGAYTLIKGSTGGRGEGVLTGDLLSFCAQLSYAIYLTFFKPVINKYSVITLMKWMTTFASLVITPFSLNRMVSLQWQSVSATTYLETLFVVFGGTFIAYICSTKAQKILHPTAIAMYNYVQPIVACAVSVIMGVGIFGTTQAFAITFVFVGVTMVNKKTRKRLS